jgi:hypothetical protein
MYASRSKQAQADLVEMSGDLVVDGPLTDEDKKHCKELVIKGFHYFDELGWSQEKESNFLARISVRREIDQLLGALQDADAMQERHRFFARLRMLSMLPAALVVIQRTLVGLNVPDDKRGEAMKQLPTPEQYSAARDVVEWCGVSNRASGGISININNENNIVPQIERRPTEVVDREQYDMDKVMTRSKVRSVLEQIVDTADRYAQKIEAVEKDATPRRSKRSKKT